MERQFFSGNSVEQAVLAAASHYGLDPSRVAYRLRDKKHGFLNIRRRVVIEVDPEAPERAPDAAPDETPEEAARPQQPETRQRPEGRPADGWQGEATSWAADEQGDRELAALERAVEEVSALLGVRLDASIRREGEGFEIDLSGPEELVEDSGKMLDAIEHLLPRMIRGLIGQGIPCRVDCRGFRAEHERRLTRLAEEVADAVRHDRREQKLEPMSPSDRRLVHLALAEDPTVVTESVGRGFYKRVRILPA